MNEYLDRLRKDERGFTLIELLIVIVILGILAGVVIFSVGGITDTGEQSACKTDLKTIEVAVEAYRAQEGNYPANLVPTLTATTQFLRWDDSLSATPTTVSLTKTGGSYTIDYQGPSGATAGEVWVNASA